MIRVREAIIWASGRLWSRLRAVAAFALAFKCLNLLLLAPLTAGLLRLFLQRWGRVSVGNFEIVSFALSPVGVSAFMGVGALLLATLYLELAGLMRLLADPRLAWWQGLIGTAGRFPRLVALGGRQLAVYLLLAVPFLAGVGGVYWLLWSGRDLNGLIVLKPPIFWAGVAGAAALVTTYAVVAGWLFLRWLFAVPAVLFEPGVSAAEALRLSVARTRGRLWTLAGALATWFALQALASAAVLALLHLAVDGILERVGHSVALVIPVTAALLVAHGLLVAILGVVADATLAGLILGLYRQAAVPEVVSDPSPAPPPTLPFRYVLAGATLTLLGLTGIVSYGLLTSLRLEDRLEITAHRGGAANAPENTVAAIRYAITTGADWAEVDVQRTKDGALVVMHDTDLARIGGGDRRVADVSLAEIRALDVGTPVAPNFAGERVPTLDEVLAAAGERIPLTIELKPHGAADETALTEGVVEAIRRAGMIERCRLCSQSYASMQLARRLEPRLRVGYIAARALGDVTKLDIDFLMVHTDLATRALVERASLRGLEIHAWTVNDPGRVARLLDKGVVNVITDDPVQLRARLEEIRALSPVERLLLRVRGMLAE